MAEAAAARDNSLDVARGVAMVLVVAGHSVRGLAAAHIGERGTVGPIDTFLYLGRLPVFALAVGLLTPATVARLGPRTYLIRRATLLIYLFLVWTVIEGTAEVLTTRWKNKPVTWLDVLSIWRPIGHLWFMPHLIVVTVLLLVAAPWRRSTRTWLCSAAVVAVSMAAWGTDPGVIGLGGLGLLVWYLFGAWVGADRFARFWRRFSTLALIVAGVVLVAVAIVMVVEWTPTVPTTDSPRTVTSVALGVIAAVVEVAGTFALTTAWSRSPKLSAWIAYVGRESLPVYLAHIMVTAGVRIALVACGVTNMWVHLAVAVPLAVAFPLVLERVTRPVPYLFVPPWVVNARRRRAVAQ